MNERHAYKLRMFLQVRSTCVRNKTKWADVPAFVNSINQLTTYIDQINELNVKRLQSSKGSTLSKKELKSNMADMTLKLAGSIKAHAALSKDTALLAKANINLSKIKTSKDVDCGDLCMTIVHLAKDLIPHLVDFKVTEKDIDETIAAINQFVAMVEKPKSDIGAVKSLNNQFESLIRVTNLHLEQVLDNIILGFKLSDEVFYAEYNAARKLQAVSTPKKDGNIPPSSELKKG